MGNLREEAAKAAAFTLVLERLFRQYPARNTIETPMPAREWRGHALSFAARGDPRYACYCALTAGVPSDVILAARTLIYGSNPDG